jgi:hypothetical protein
MKTLIIFGVLVMGSAMGTAWASDCPSNLNAEQTYNCIVSQGAESDYADDANQAKAQSDEQQPAARGQTTDQQASADSTNHNM